MLNWFRNLFNRKKKETPQYVQKTLTTSSQSKTRHEHLPVDLIVDVAPAVDAVIHVADTVVHQSVDWTPDYSEPRHHTPTYESHSSWSSDSGSSSFDSGCSSSDSGSCSCGD